MDRTARCSFHCPRGRRHGHGRSGGRLRDAGGGLPSLLLARLTDWGPVAMYGALKLTDFAKITVVHLWLKKEKWVKKLTVQAA